MKKNEDVSVWQLNDAKEKQEAILRIMKERGLKFKSYKEFLKLTKKVVNGKSN